MTAPTQILPEEHAQAAPPRQPRLYVLDGLRLVAAVMVLFGHWVGTGAYGGGPPVWGEQAEHVFPTAMVATASFGWSGVALFFLISGFVICMSSWDRDLASFARSRIVRLLPAYWVCVLLTTACLAVTAGRGVDLVELFSGAVTNLTMVQKGYGVSHIDPVYWTLWSELKFYLLFAVVVFFGLTYRRVVTFCWLWMIAATLAQASGEPLLSEILQPRYAAYFIAGIAFYLIRRFGPTLMLWLMIATSFAVAQNQIQSFASSEIKAMRWHFPLWGILLLLFGYFVLMALVALGGLDVVTGRWLVTAGALTYPLYLLHQVIGLEAIHFLHSRIPAYPLLAGMFVGMLLLAYLVHVLVEKPGGRRLHREITRSYEAMRRPEREPAA
ncbi:MAG: acyltransferase [Streptosporangiaceae bacterium]